MISEMLNATAYHPRDMINELIDNSIGAIRQTPRPSQGYVHVYFESVRRNGYPTKLLCIADNGCGFADRIHAALLVRGDTSNRSALSEHKQGLKQCLVNRRFLIVTRTGDAAFSITHNTSDKRLWLPSSVPVGLAELTTDQGQTAPILRSGTIVRVELSASETRSLLRRPGRRRTRAADRSVLRNIRLHLEETYRGVMDRYGIRFYVGTMDAPLAPPAVPRRTLAEEGLGFRVKGRNGGTYTIDVRRYVLRADAPRPRRRVEFRLDGRLLTSRHPGDVYTNPPASSGDQIIVVDLNPGGRPGLWPTTTTTKTDFNASDEALEDLLAAVRASPVQPRATQDPTQMDEATRTRRLIRMEQGFLDRTHDSPPRILQNHSLRCVMADAAGTCRFQLDYYQAGHTDDATGFVFPHVIEEHKIGPVNHHAVGQIMSYAVAYDAWLREKGADRTHRVRYRVRAKSCTPHFAWQLEQRQRNYEWYMYDTVLEFTPWDDG